MIAFRHIKSLVKNSLYCSIATVNQNDPYCSPVGSVYLENETQGYYLEMFTRSVSRAQPENSTGCIMAVNTSMLFWLKSLFKGKFETPPAVRLIVKFGELRESTAIEQQRFKKRVKLFRRLKGHQILWSNPGHVREFTIESVVPVSLGKMTRADYAT